MSATASNDGHIRHDERARLLLDVRSRLAGDDLSECPSLELLGISVEGVMQIARRLERFQTWHAIGSVALLMVAIGSAIASLVIFTNGGSAALGVIVVILGIVCVVAGILLLPGSIHAHLYWKHHSEELDVVSTYEQWHQLRRMYDEKVMARDRKLHQLAEEQKQREENASRYIEKVQSTMENIERQFHDTIAAREERIKLVPIEPITSAKQLSKVFAGIDDDVKAAFARLSPSSLCALMIDYEAMYGVSARRYAEKSWRLWADNDVEMSPIIAQRLIALVPRFMSADAIYELIRKIRERYLPPKVQREVTCRSDELREAVLPIVDEVIARSSQLSLPPAVVDRVGWLLDGDAIAIQKLLAAIETDEAEQRLTFLEEEFSRIERLLIDSPGRGKVMHRIDLPQGTITVLISKARPNLLQLAKRLLS